MEKAYTIRERRLSELEGMDGDMYSPGDYLYIDPHKAKALKANPFLWQEDSPVQEIGTVDGKAGGYNFIFPIGLWIDGKEYGAATGSSLNVQEWARSTSMGLELPTVGTDRSAKDKIAVAASCSQMAVPVHQVNGYKFFFMSRLVGLFKSRSVIEMFIRNRAVARVVSWCVDRVLGCVFFVLSIICRLRLTGVKINEICATDESALKLVAELVRSDEGRFSELHDERWFRWHLTQSFSKDGPCRLWCFWKNGLLIGFIMLKKRFHEQASHRGFRNVWLASVCEWGCMKGEDSLLKFMIFTGAQLMRRDGVDACELVTVDLGLQSFFRRIGWRQVGKSNYGVKVWPRSPLVSMKNELQNHNNWRLRPAMGDNGLS